MKVVADSHIILWYLGDPVKLSSAATAALDDADDTDGIGVSIASLPDIWYSTQKKGADRVAVDDYEELKATLIDAERNAHVLSITERSMAHLDAFPRAALRDPFDRFIVATALEHELPLVTADKRIIDLGVVTTIW